eukprot:gene25706-biopygen10536
MSRSRSWSFALQPLTTRRGGGWGGADAHCGVQCFAPHTPCMAVYGTPFSAIHPV